MLWKGYNSSCSTGDTPSFKLFISVLRTIIPDYKDKIELKKIFLKRIHNGFLQSFVLLRWMDIKMKMKKKCLALH